MAFVKRHLMLLSCGVVGVLALAAIIVGYVVGDVRAEMEQATSLVTRLRALHEPANDKSIQVAQQKYDDIEREYKNVLAVVATMNKRDPLRENVFPSPKVAADLFDFRAAYRRALNDLLDKVLMAKPPPDDRDVQNMQAQIDHERQEELRKKLGPAGIGANPQALGGQAVTAMKSFVQQDYASMTPEELAKNHPSVRASLVRAHQIRCYASFASLHSYPDVLQGSSVPDIEALWDAQMSYWIQADVIGALAKVNEAAAARLKAEKRENEINVCYLPVKELRSIQIGDYVFGAAGGGGLARLSESRWAEIAPGQTDANAPLLTPSASFTHRTSNALYDVINFTVTLVVDSRELPTVVDAISGANFFTILTVATAAVSPNTQLVGRIYGPDPVIEVRFDIEGCFFREIYHPMMPPSLRTQIEQGQRVGRMGQPTGPGPVPGFRGPPIGPPTRMGPMTGDVPPT